MCEDAQLFYQCTCLITGYFNYGLELLWQLRGDERDI